jgi:hypothetical protein
MFINDRGNPMTARRHDTEQLRREIQRLREAESACTCADVLATTRADILETLMRDAADDVRSAMVEIKRDMTGRGISKHRAMFLLGQALAALSPTAVITAEHAALTAEQVLECEG